MNLLIGTPAYNGMVHIDYVNSIISIISTGLKCSVLFIGNESLITRARNTIFSYFVYDQSYTHLLFLDGDIGIKSNDVIKLLRHDKDIIGAPVRLKGIDSDGRPIYNIGQIYENGDLWKVSKIGTAVLLISRKAAIDAVNNLKLNTYNKVISRGKDISNIIQYDAFNVGVSDGQYQSEDFWFCNNMRSIGYDIFVDYNIEVIHNGMLPL